MKKHEWEGKRSKDSGEAERTESGANMDRGKSGKDRESRIQ